MGKENVCPANTGDGRIMTRSRAAAFCASGKLPPNGPTRPGEKSSRTSIKRAALEENTACLPSNAPNKHKRRAVLSDVTNVCCENSYRMCFNAAKSQVKNVKQAKRVDPKGSKVAPSIDKKTTSRQANSTTKTVKEATETENKFEESDQESWSNNARGVCMDLNKPQNQNCGAASVDDKYRFFGDLKTSGDPDFTDIDYDHKDAQLCTEYAPDIYMNLRVTELQRKPQASYMEVLQQDITQSMRGILIDWLVEVSEEYKLQADTLYLTVSLIDRYLSQNCIERPRLQLLGVTCMLIASKYEEIYAPRVEEFCMITDNTYSKGEVLKMETQVLKSLGFQLFAPTAKTFLQRYLRAAKASYKNRSYEVEYLADYLAELTLVCYDFLNFHPSVIAASAVFLARWTLDQTSHPWNPTLEHYTTYKASDLKTSVLALQELQLNTSGCPLTAVRTKYRQQKLKSVAALSSPKLLETLFINDGVGMGC